MIYYVIEFTYQEMRGETIKHKKRVRNTVLQTLLSKKKKRGTHRVP